MAVWWYPSPLAFPALVTVRGGFVVVFFLCLLRSFCCSLLAACEENNDGYTGSFPIDLWGRSGCLRNCHAPPPPRPPGGTCLCRGPVGPPGDKCLYRGPGAVYGASPHKDATSASHAEGEGESKESQKSIVRKEIHDGLC